MKDRDVIVATKIKIAETIIFPIVTYGSESWTVQKKDRKKLTPLSYGRGEKFYEYCGQRRTSLSVLEEVKPKRSLEATIIRSRLRYFSHVMRAKGSLEQDIMLGQVAGHRRQGKPQL
jgi:hypothetical protein